MSKLFNPPSYAKLAIRALHAMNKYSGFSFNAVGEEPIGGYMVSLASKNKPIEANARTVASFIKTNPISGAQYYGGWRTGDYMETKGSAYLDVSENVASFTDAVRTAVENKQIAIYDVARGKSIILRSKRRQYTVKQRIALHLRRSFRLIGMADQCGQNSAERSKLLRQASLEFSAAEDLSESTGETLQSWWRRYDRIATEIRRQYR